MNGSKSAKTLKLPESVLGILLPFFGYFAAFLFEGGYFIKLNLPLEFIEVNLREVLFATLILLISALIYLLRTIEVFLFPKFEVFISSAVFILLPVSFFLFGLTGFLIWLMILISLFTCAFKIEHYDNPKKPISAGRSLEILFLSLGIIYKRLAKRIGAFYSTSVILLLLILILSLLIGAFYASSQREYVIIKSSPELIVLRKHADQFFCSTFDRKEKRLTGNFYLVSFEQISSERTMLKEEKVGPLRTR